MGSSSTTNFTDSNRRLKQYLNKANRSRQADTNNSDHNNQKKLYTWNSISTIDLKKSQSIGALLWLAFTKIITPYQTLFSDILL